MLMALFIYFQYPITQIGNPSTCSQGSKLTSDNARTMLYFTHRDSVLRINMLLILMAFFFKISPKRDANDPTSSTTKKEIDRSRPHLLCPLHQGIQVASLADSSQSHFSTWICSMSHSREMHGNICERINSPWESPRLLLSKAKVDGRTWNESLTLNKLWRF